MKIYDLKLSEQVLGVIATALVKAPMPREITDIAVHAIEEQVNEQNKEDEPPPAVKSKRGNGHAAASR